MLNDLAPKTVLNGRVEERQVDTPNLIWGFGCVLLVPNSEQRLVRQIHWSVQVSIAVAVESCALGELIEYRGQLRLTDQVFKGLISQIAVGIRLTVDVGAEFHEFRLDVLVDHVLGVRAIVKVLIPVDTDIMGARDSVPVSLVCLSESGTFFGASSDQCIHGQGSEGASYHQKECSDAKADRATAQLLPLGDL